MICQNQVIGVVTQEYMTQLVHNSIMNIWWYHRPPPPGANRVRAPTPDSSGQI